MRNNNISASFEAIYLKFMIRFGFALAKGCLRDILSALRHENSLANKQNLQTMTREATARARAEIDASETKA